MHYRIILCNWLKIRVRYVVTKGSILNKRHIEMLDCHKKKKGYNGQIKKKIRLVEAHQ
jgi:hypothetical protein